MLSPLKCYLDQIVGVIALFTFIAVTSLIVKQFISKRKKKQNFFVSKKTWMIFSMWLFGVYLIIEFNFTIFETLNPLVYFKWIIMKYLNSFSVIFVAYYFFCKAVQGYN